MTLGGARDAARGTLAERAASLDERLAAPAAAADDLGRRHFELWLQAFARGDRERLLRRLAWDGLDEERALCALSTGAGLPEDASWAETLGELVTAARAGEGADRLERLDAERRIPFAELWLPLVALAARRLRARAGPLSEVAAPEALADLERGLLAELARYGELAAYESFDAWRRDGGAYASWVRTMLGGGLKELLAAHPVLARHLVRLADRWTDATVELFERLDRDGASLAEALFDGRAPGRLVRTETGLSDPHDGGRRVAVLRFETGLAAVYKPRPVALERAFQDLLRWAAAEGLDPCPPPLRIVDAGDYGWVEHAEPGVFSDPRAVRAYYRRAGALVCLAFALRGRDLHMENVVATEAGPVLVDAEMLCQPVLRSDLVPLAPVHRETEADDSCLATGLVSLLERDGRGRIVDLGGLRGRGGGAPPITRREWLDVGTDAIRWRPAASFAPRRHNAVRLDGAEIGPEDAAEELLAGFDAAYRFLLERRDELLAEGGPLDGFRGTTTRVLFRSTTQYGALLYLLAAPRYQRCGVRRSLAIETLARPLGDEPARPRLWPLVAEERRSLEALDVPRFAVAVDATAIRCSSGASIDDAYLLSGLDAVRRRIAALSEADRDEERARLEDALENTDAARFATPPPAEDAAALELEAARWIGSELLARARPAEDGSLFWGADARRARAGRLEGRAFCLSGGLAGVALFFGGLAAASGERRFADAARGAAAPLGRLLEPEGAALLDGLGLGAGDGLGSLVYALVVTGRLVGDDGLVGLAERFASRIDPERIAAEEAYDVLAGTAGAILALLALRRASPSARWLDRAETCARRLLEGSVSAGGGRAWPAPDGRLLAGFAHGAAGIGLAFARLFAATGTETYRRAALDAFAFERSRFSPRHRNWPVPPPGGRGEEAVMTAWCHGAAGVGLARALAIEVLDDDALRGECALALETTGAAPPSRSDHACCGSLARIEALDVAGRRLGRADLVAAARERLAPLLARARAERRFALPPASPFRFSVFDAGFLHGLSGIGYGLARIAAPETLPSVLGFEAEPSSPAEPRP